MPYSQFSTKETPQTQSIPGKKMQLNNAGGYGFEVDKWRQFDRLLILGTEGGSYYVNETKLTADNALNAIECIKDDGIRTVKRILEISDSGRAPKNDPALFALALCTSPTFADVETRRLAFKVLPKVARIGTHLFSFITFMKKVRGFGKLAQTGIQEWYQSKDPAQLAFQLVKYKRRLGWTHSDALRLAKPIPITELHNQLYGFAKRGYIEGEHDFQLIKGFSKIQEVETANEAAKLINDYRLPMEAIPTEFKKEPVVWEALLPHLPITATIKNLKNMARCNFMTPMSDAAKVVANRISDAKIIMKGRVHPIQFLNALLNFPTGTPRVLINDAFYPQMHKADKSTWLVATNVVEALNSGFQASFQSVIPSNKRVMLALDVSGSMDWKWCLGMKGLTPREASAALALITVNTEPNHFIGVFTRNFRQFTGIKKGMSVDDAIKSVHNLTFGNTDIASPIIWAAKNKLPIDMISCYTDNETYWKTIHPCQALVKYRNQMGINTKFVSVSMCANETTVADPSDPGMLDVIGFDTATPRIISEFADM